MTWTFSFSHLCLFLKRSNEKQSCSNSLDLEYFIICGLGSLGQHCVVSLNEFDVKIIAIEQQLPIAWEIKSWKDLLEDVIIGDCRHNDILHRAKIQRCRAALIVTTDDRVNVETAIAIRQLNPATRLVVRSDKVNLNQLLSRQLSNYTAFEPTELSTAAFTLAALGTEILGFFELDGQIWQVYQRQITIKDRWRDRSILSLWIRLFSFILTIVATVFVGVIYALLTEALLSSRFEFAKQPPPIPQQDHIVIVGMGKTGQKVKALLAKFQQQMVGVTFNPSFEGQFASDIPLVTGNLETALTTANLSQAKSIVIVTDDEILNLETALMAKAIAPHLNLVLKTSGIRISRHLKTLLPTAQIVGVYGVAAAAFAGAAFGENILNLFRLRDNTILVTEYRIEAEDTLHGLLLADIAYGYGVVPIVYQQLNRISVPLPLDEPPLKVAERLVVLATIDGLRRIEQGLLNLEAKQWQIRIDRALTTDAIFDGANAIARITGCSLTLARETMNNLPQTLPVLLYQHQAHRLVKELKKTLVVSHLLTKR